MKFQLDCGATVNVLPLYVYQRIYRDPQMTRLQPSHTNLVMLNKSELKSLGRVKVEILNPKNEQCLLVEYTVEPSGHSAFLGAETVQQFGLITLNADKIMSLSDEPPTKQDFVSEFDDIFLGEEKLEGKLHLELDRTVLPVALPVRKVPFAMKEPLKQELNRSVKTGIVIPVDVPTD